MGKTNERQVVLESKMQEFFKTKNKESFQEFLQVNDYSIVERMSVFHKVSKEYKQVSVYRLMQLSVDKATDKKIRGELIQYMSKWLKEEGLTEGEMQEMITKYPNTLELA
ncbi:hypothetical protein [Bacillus sp. NPDC094106]|uniref:hypothetical protein n=1 Tax=Bacillus sp. NPDC094106 TaxID=3363949 RepID=UPI0037F5D28A